MSRYKNVFSLITFHLPKLIINKFQPDPHFYLLIIVQKNMKRNGEQRGARAFLLVTLHHIQ